MDWGELRRHWTTSVNIFVLHAKKVGIFSAGLVIAAVAYGLLTSSTKKAPVICESARNELVPAPDTCPWQFVMSDLAHRLRLIEMAFKEQVIAREIMAAEVTNQTFSNLELVRKLENFTSTIQQLSTRIEKLSEQVNEVSSRLYSDECLGFLVLVFVAGQVILTLRAKLNIRHGSETPHHQSRHGSHDLTNQNGASCSHLKNLPSLNTPGSQVPLKQTVSYSRQDVCLVSLNKSAWKQNADMAETLFRCVTDDAHSPSPTKHYYVIDSPDSLHAAPRAKLYIVLMDCTADFGGGGEGLPLYSSAVGEQQTSRLLTALRHLRSIGGHVIVVMVNEVESQHLPAHCLYNIKMAAIQNSELLQELASNGRVLSLWKELSASQLGHICKAARALLSFKGK